MARVVLLGLRLPAVTAAVQDDLLAAGRRRAVHKKARANDLLYSIDSCDEHLILQTSINSSIRQRKGRRWEEAVTKQQQATPVLLRVADDC